MSLWKNGPPVIRALAAQGLAFGAVALLAYPLASRLPFWTWPLLQGALAAALAHRWGLHGFWMAFQVLLPIALAWQLGHSAPVWIYPAALAGLLLVFGGGLLTRVPLYNSSRAAWDALLGLLPADQGLVVADLGAGLGGPLAYLGRQRGDLRLLGVEASPLLWGLARLRTWPLRHRCRLRLGSLWAQPLGEVDVLYVFLSPAPMPELWAKARREMKPGTLLVSNTFPVPGLIPDREIPLPERRDARLLVYRL